MEKGEIAHHEQFLLFPQFFQKTRKNQGLFGKGLIQQDCFSIENFTLLTFSKQFYIYPFQIQPVVLHVCSISLLKTLGEKEKLLIIMFSKAIFLKVI